MINLALITFLGGAMVFAWQSATLPAYPSAALLLYIINGIGWPAMGLAIYRGLKILRRIDYRTMVWEQEHELVMGWWEENHPGQRRPAELLAMARKAGM